MSLALLALVFIVCLALGYSLYGRFVGRVYALNDKAQTPSEAMSDGVDFVSTRPFYLLGQHVSAIAAAGPIAGPILACQAFGWLPCALWILFGGIFIGAVHDFSALVASVRHRGMSVAEIVKENLGRRAWLAITLFIWVSLLYVIIAFTDITASTFVGLSDELPNGTWFNPGGAVAAASIMYLSLAIVMGLVQKYFRPPLWLMTIVFVPATLGVVWLGTKISTWFLFGSTTWGVLILLYCFVASLIPLWLLLQPRGYLGGFVLYIALAVGVLGIFFGGFEIKQEAFKTFNAAGPAGTLFPFLFVTIACGACSGFHGLVCSGTTSKQIAKEPHCKPVGYGGMLIESFVALIALSTVMIVTNQEMQGQGPGIIYGNGLAHFVTTFLGSKHFLFAATFGAMAFSTFVFDTLDCATRLGRYVLQELFGWRGKAGAIVATGLTVAIPMISILTAKEGSYRIYWTLFGTSNQLLAALTLMSIVIWLKKQGKPTWFVLIPALFVMAMTLWALALQIGWGWSFVAINGLRIDTVVMNAFVALALFLLATSVMKEAVAKCR